MTCSLVCLLLQDIKLLEEKENLDLPKLIQAVEIINSKSPELAMKLPRYIHDAIKNVYEKHFELEHLLKDIFLLPWCTCGKCCQGPLCNPDERVCCKREKGNCLTESAVRISS